MLKSFLVGSSQVGNNGLSWLPSSGKFRFGGTSATSKWWCLMMLLVHLLLLSNMTSSSNSGSFWVEAAMPWGISFVWGSARFCVTKSQKNKTIKVVQMILFFVMEIHHVSKYMKVIQTKPNREQEHCSIVKELKIHTSLTCMFAKPSVNEFLFTRWRFLKWSIYQSQTIDRLYWMWLHVYSKYTLLNQFINET